MFLFSANFIYAYRYILAIFTPPNFSHILHTSLIPTNFNLPPSPTFIYLSVSLSLSFYNPWLQFVLCVYTWVWDHPLEQGWLVFITVTYILEKNTQSLLHPLLEVITLHRSSVRGGNPSPHHAARLVGWILCRSHEDNCSFYGLRDAGALPCLEDTGHLWLSWGSLNFGSREHGIDILFGAV